MWEYAEKTHRFRGALNASTDTTATSVSIRKNVIRSGHWRQLCEIRRINLVASGVIAPDFSNTYAYVGTILHSVSMTHASAMKWAAKTEVTPSRRRKPQRASVSSSDIVLSS